MYNHIEDTKQRIGYRKSEDCSSCDFSKKDDNGLRCGVNPKGNFPTDNKHVCDFWEEINELM